MDSMIVALGAGLYWASMMVRPFFWGTESAFSDVESFLPVGIALVALLTSSHLTGRGLKIGMLFALVCAVDFFVVSIVPDVICASHVVETICFGLARLASPLLMLFWGVQFAAVSRRRAFFEVMLTVLVSALVFCSFVATSALAGPVYEMSIPIGALLTVVSSCLLLVASKMRVSCFERRQFKSDELRHVIQFTCSRLLIGLVMGLLIAAFDPVDGGASSWSAVPAMFVSVCCVCALALCMRRRVDAMALLPLACLSICSLLPITVFPTIQLSQGLLYSSVWLAWITMSSVQLSEFKYQFGMGELRLVFYEKLLVLVAIVVGRMVGDRVFLVDNSTFTLVGESVSTTFALWFVLAWVVCCYGALALQRLSRIRDREELVREVVSDNDDRLGNIYRCIARDYGLSEREAEILGYIAQGHTRAYICKSLKIATGTVKTHIGNIYKKIDCHSREDVLALVRQYTTFNE